MKDKTINYRAGKQLTRNTGYTSLIKPEQLLNPLE